MKQTVLRIICACLLLSIGAAAMVGVIAAVNKGEEPLAVWSTLRFHTQGQQLLRIYDEGGSLIQLLRSDDKGLCSTVPLGEGTYHTACAQGYASVEIGSGGEVRVQGAAVLETGGLLSFLGQKETLVQIHREAREEWYEYVLQNGESRQNQVLRAQPGEQLQCSFTGLPYGEYDLLENGKRLCSLTLSEEKNRVVLRIP